VLVDGFGTPRSHGPLRGFDETARVAPCSSRTLGCFGEGDVSIVRGVTRSRCQRAQRFHSRKHRGARGVLNESLKVSPRSEVRIEVHCWRSSCSHVAGWVVERPRGASGWVGGWLSVRRDLTARCGASMRMLVSLRANPRILVCLGKGAASIVRGAARSGASRSLPR
jgi:hypothetical protein